MTFGKFNTCVNVLWAESNMRSASFHLKLKARQLGTDIVNIINNNIQYGHS